MCLKLMLVHRLRRWPNITTILGQQLFMFIYPRSSRSPLNELMLIMFMVYALCFCDFLNSWTTQAKL